MADQKPPCLTVLGGPMAGNRFVLQDGVANILIGSDPVCAFHLPLPGVSAMHARIAVEPGGVSLWEAGSPKGLHVNDSRVEVSAPLRNGDIVWLGTPGDGDVVMLQCILPRLPALVTADEPGEEDEASPAVEGETVALDPRSLSLEPEDASPAPPVEMVDHAEPLAIPLVVDSPLDAHFASVSTMAEPEEAGVVVDADAESFVKTADETLMASPAAPDHDFVLADEGMPLTIQEPASSYTPPAPPPPSPIVAPPGFEDETEERLIEADTMIVAPAQEPTTYAAATAHPVAPPVPPARVPPAALSPAPTPAAARAATPPARPARPATTPPTRKPTGPSVSQRTEPAEKAPPAAAAPAAKSSTGLYAGIGLGALVVLAGGGYALTKMMAAKPAASVAEATPPPVAPTAAPTEAAVAPAPAPVEEAPVVEVPAPAPVVATPTPPAGRPTPTPTPTPAKAGATPAPTPTPAATPAGPSAEQVRAQQVAGLLTQADSALGARQFDQAIGHLDEVLKLDPGNAKATSERAAAVAARDVARRRFVAGRTVVTTEKAAGGGLSGFEGAAVQKAPDFLGRIEFEMTPSSGLKAGDPWTLKLFVVNEGKKLIRITDLTATAVVNGERTGGASGARAREIAPQARVPVGEMAGAWKDGTQTWAAEVILTAKGDSLKNTLTWR